MNDLTLLSGKVRKHSLAAIEGPPGPDAPRLKRLLLAQGELAHFYDSDQDGARYIAFVELRASAVRGNHYHQVKEEWVYIISGKTRLAVVDTKTSLRASLDLQRGDLAVIEPGIAHAFETFEPGQAIEFSKSRFDSADVFRYAVL